MVQSILPGGKVASDRTGKEKAGSVTKMSPRHWLFSLDVMYNTL
jgi:hypothetical protein